MSDRISAECPHCHRVGTLPNGVEPGRKVRCPSCRKPFAFEPQPGPQGAGSGAGNSAAYAESWDEAVIRAKEEAGMNAAGPPKAQPDISEGASPSDFEKRLRHVERANQRLKVGLALAVLLAIASFLFRTKAPGSALAGGSEVVATRITTPRIVTRELVLVDSDGNPVGGINSLLNFGRLEFNGSDNRLQVEPWGVFLWNGEKPRIFLRAGHGKDSEAGMTLHDDTGKIHIELSATRHDTRLMLSDHMAPIIEMRSSDSGPSLEYRASPRGLYETIIPKPSSE